MSEFIIAVAIAIYLAWGIGVHTLGSALGPVIGGGVLSLRKAVVFAGVFALLGFTFYSKGIINTLGTQLVQLELHGAAVVVITVALVVTLLALRGLPMSTTYVVVGAIAGYSITAGLNFNYTVFERIVFALFASPIAAAAIAWMIYHAIRRGFRSHFKKLVASELLETAFFSPSLAAFALMTFALGANSLGVVVGVLGGKVEYSSLVILGSLGFILGLSTWSYRVARTVGVRLTDLSPSRGFAAQLAAGLTALVFISLSIPISMTQTMIGGIIGVSLARKKFEKKILKRILLAWGVALPAAFALAAAIGWLV